MLTLQFIRENKEEVLERLSIKNFRNISLIDEVLQIDEQRRRLQKEHDELLAETNALAKEIGNLFKSGKSAEADQLKIRNSELKEQAKELSVQLESAQNLLQQKLVEIPNLPHISVPHGRTPADNIVVMEGGVMPLLPADAVPHWDLITRYNLIDFELAISLEVADFNTFSCDCAHPNSPM